METISGGYKYTMESPPLCHPASQSDVQHSPSPLPCCGAPAAARAEPEGRGAAGTGSLPPGASRMAQAIEDHPLASGRCPHARPPPAASACGQVHAGGAAVAASICSLHSHRPAPRRAPGRWSLGGLSY